SVPPAAALRAGPAVRVALDDEELGERSIALLAVGELSREAAAVERALPPGELFRLASRLAHAGRFDALQDDAATLGRMLFEIDREPIVQQRLDRSFHLAVAEFRLRLPLELGLGHLHAHDRREALTDVLALQRLVVFLGETVGDRVSVERPRESRLEADQMRPALDRVDVVGEGVDVL